MALDKDFLVGVFDGVENAEERIEKVLKEYDTDVTGIKVNREQILSEKKAIEEKYREIENTNTSLQERLKELKEKMKKSGSEEAKQFYEAEKKKLEEQYATQLAERDAKLSRLDAENKELSQKYVENSLRSEFIRSIEGLPVNPKTLDAFQDLFLMRNKFKLTPYEGKEKFLTEDFRDMKNVINAFITTDTGKMFLLQNNSGGGSEGSKNVQVPMQNPWAKETLNLTKQAQILKENPDLAARFKSAVGAPV
jgi:predicted RNase H-like nuclease (RuvC/YqgF family)